MFIVKIVIWSLAFGSVSLDAALGANDVGRYRPKLSLNLIHELN